MAIPIAFIGLCNEYCNTLEKASDIEADAFVKLMVQLLPRIYITACDLQPTAIDLTDEIPPVMEEEFYDQVRTNISKLLGEDDSFLEVFEDEMSYSEAPLSSSISESLADLFQVFYNYLSAVKDAPDDVVENLTQALKEDFQNYWSQILCNVMRPLNHLCWQGNLS